MKSQYNQFIGMYDQVFPDLFCQHLINEFERYNRSGVVTTRKETEGVEKNIKSDSFMFLNIRNHQFDEFNGRSSTDIIWDSLQKCFTDYSDEFDIIKGIPMRAHTLKMQKTNPGEGYHVWHCEQEGRSSANRSAVFAFYLNSLDNNDGGETEFLYQKLRIPCKENTCIIWPAGFTHPHRGNTVLGNKSKYVLTGWFYNEL